MASVHVWKIGSYYENIEDKNGGKAEYNFIYNAIAKACEGKAELMLEPTPLNHDEKGKIVSFIVNGKAGERDLERAELARKNSDVLVFILTDYGFIPDNEPIIKMCDYVLHQSPLKQFKLFDIPGEYSYVPELFYDESLPVSNMKMNLCFFGGNMVGREQTFDMYLLESKNKANFKKKMAVFYKDDKGNDFRVEYNNYRRILSLFEFALISGRSAGSDVGWVTPRFVEAINAGCFPVLVDGYDSDDHFGFDSYRAQNADAVWWLVTRGITTDMKKKIEAARERIQDGKLSFYKIIQKLIAE